MSVLPFPPPPAPVASYKPIRLGQPTPAEIDNRAKHLEFTRVGIYRVEQDPRISARDQVRQWHNLIMSHEDVCNSKMLVCNGKPYLLAMDEWQLLEVTRQPGTYTAWLCSKFGILHTDPQGQRVIDAMINSILKFGIVTELKRFTYYSNTENALYVSRYDGSCYRLDGHTVTIVPNGYACVFADDDGGEPCLEPDIGPNGMFLPRLVDDVNFVPITGAGVSVESQRHMFALWLFSIAFSERVPAKPILIVEGERGSGKTTLLQKAQLVLHGRDYVLSLGQKDEDDFAVALIRKPICVLDNIDTFIDWLPDMLCAYTTGASSSRRKKYSDDAQILITPKAFLAVSTRNPVTFQRDDVADRSVVLRVERRDGFEGVGLIMNGIRMDRDQLYGEWLYYLNKIVAEYQTYLMVDAQDHRLADFAENAYYIGRAVGFTPEEVEKALAAAQAERDGLIAIGDPVIDVLDRWLSTEANQGREILVSDLFDELSKLAVERGMLFPKTIKALNVKLLAAHAQLEKDLGMVKKGAGRGLTYTFRRVG